MYRTWMNSVSTGDVLKDMYGNLRVVRKVTRYSERHPRAGLLKCVTFAIKRCSWTGRGDTVLTYTDLDYRGFKPTGRRLPLRTAMDKKFKTYLSTAAYDRKSVTCCDVIGVIS